MSSQQRKKPCSSSVIIGSNHDLLSNILSLLPAQSLIRLQLVNKHWRSTISSASFRRLHSTTLRRPPPPPRATFLLRLEDTADLFTFTPTTTNKLLPFHFGHLRYSHVEILQSCNGLLLLECFNKDSTSNEYNYLVFNPTTMRSRNLRLRLSKPFLALSLLFDPNKSPYYRVVCFLKCTNSAVLVTVYDSSARKWNEVELANESDKLSNEGVSGGVYYWNDGVYFARSKLFYDGSGKGKKVNDPFADEAYESVESNGRVYCVRVPLKEWLRVWELSKDGFRWSEVCNVRLDWIMSSGRDDDDVSFLGLVRGDDDAMMSTTLLLQTPGKIMVYGFGADGTMSLSGFEKVVDFSGESYCKRKRGVIQSRFGDAHQLVHTLVPV